MSKARRGRKSQPLKENPSPVGSRIQGYFFGHSLQVCSLRTSSGNSLVLTGQGLGNEHNGCPDGVHVAFHSSKSLMALIGTGFCIHWITCISKVIHNIEAQLIT